MKDTLKPGLTYRKEYKVPQGKTVSDLIPESAEADGIPDVLATGYLVGILEWACVEAINDYLDDGEFSLGIHVNFSHLAPTLPGSTLVIDVKLVEIDGKTLLFEVQAKDDVAQVSTGTHRRGVANRARFIQRLDSQRQQLAALND